MRAPGGGSDRIAPESVGGRVGSRPLRAGLVVSTHYAEGERFEPVDRGATRGLMILIGNTVLVRERPRFALDILMPVARDAGILEGVRGEADEAAAWLLRHLDAATSEE